MIEVTEYRNGRGEEHIRETTLLGPVYESLYTANTVAYKTLLECYGKYMNKEAYAGRRHRPIPDEINAESPNRLYWGTIVLDPYSLRNPIQVTASVLRRNVQPIDFDTYSEEKIARRSRKRARSN